MGCASTATTASDAQSDPAEVTEAPDELHRGSSRRPQSGRRASKSVEPSVEVDLDAQMAAVAPLAAGIVAAAPAAGLSSIDVDRLTDGDGSRPRAENTK